MYFDDIRLYAARCVLEKRDPCFARVDYVGAQCVVDAEELEIMFNDWLETDSTVYATAPGDANLVAHYEFTGDFNDSSANGLDGDANGAYTLYDADLDSDVAVFDGADDYVDCGNSALFDITDAITVACWIKVQTFDKTWQAIVTKGDNSWRLHRNSESDNINFASTGTTPLSITGSTNVNDGAWHHIAAAYDGVQRLLYVDGQVDASATATGSIDKGTYPVYIGENAQATGRYWSGLIDDVRIYNSGLSQGQILSIMGLPEIYFDITSAANVYKEGKNNEIVNFKDYALLAERWLEKDYFPPE